MAVRGVYQHSVSNSPEWDRSSNVAAGTDCTQIVWHRASRLQNTAVNLHVVIASGVNAAKWDLGTPGGTWADQGLAWRFHATSAAGAWGVYDVTTLGGLVNASDIASRWSFDAAYSDQSAKDVGLAVRADRAGRLFRLRRNSGSAGSGSNRNWGKLIIGSNAAAASSTWSSETSLFDGQLSWACLSWLALRPENVHAVRPRSLTYWRVNPRTFTPSAFSGGVVPSTGDEMLVTTGGIASTFVDTGPPSLPVGRRSRCSRFGRNTVAAATTIPVFMHSYRQRRI